jgi:oligopeptide/dipeptide ABC transporter ATP-binding protein
MAETLLYVEDLTVSFATESDGTPRPSVAGVGFGVGKGEIVGVVGESGSGKTVTARAIAGLLPGNAHIGGTIEFDGTDLAALSGNRARTARRGISYIFQNPVKALDPVFTVGSQLTETLRAQRGLRGSTVESTAIELLASVGIPEPARRMKEYPHAFSGGMAQRVMIALSLAGSPRLLVADEPTSALDVSIQAQILSLLSRLREERGMSIVFISHSLGAVAELCDRIVVMYGGRVLEVGATEQIMRDPRHPYTLGLLQSAPQLRADPQPRDVPFQEIPPAENLLPPTVTGCNFANRCRFARARCTSEPATMRGGGTHGTRCLRSEELFSQAGAA